MEMNMYYQRVFVRRNILKEVLFNIFFSICSWPRLVVEVFIRRNMGERYFSFASAITVLTVLALIPAFSLMGFKRFQHEFGISTFIKFYFTWYVFLTAFLYMAIQRRNEIRRLPSVFDFARFSKSTGFTHPAYLKFITRGKRFDPRTIETKLEPRYFFFIGFGLSCLGQPVGSVLMYCSIIYALSYRAAYYLSDQDTMDRIDGLICNEEMAKSMIEGRNSSETRGFEFRGRLPASVEDRRRLANLYMQMEETVEAI